MSFDGFDAGLLIELSPFASIDPETTYQDTLEAALAKVVSTEQRVFGPITHGYDIAATKDEARLTDLWDSRLLTERTPLSNGPTAFGPLLIDELDDAPFNQPVNQSQEDQHVIVTGHRYVYDGIGSYQSEGDHWTYSSEQPVPPPEQPAPTPEDLNCSDTSQMSPEQLLDYKISEEAAKIAREILAMPDHDIREYAAFIYMDSDGQIRHTPIQAGGPTSAAPSDAGIRYGQIYGVIHSHPAVGYNPGYPDLRLYPTLNNAGQGQGDWYVYDNYAGGIYNSLIYEYNNSVFQATTHMAQFRQYILGATGASGTNQYQLHGYDMNDRDISTLGQKISLNLGLCS